MSSLTFEKKGGIVLNAKWLWNAVKLVFQTLSDGEYVWPHPEKKKKTRTAAQNRYMWGVVYEYIHLFTGYTPEEVHQEMGKLFLSYEKNGKQFVRSTTKLSTVEKEEYLENVRRFVASDDSFRNDEGAGLYIPLPNEPDNFYYEVR